MFKRLFLGLFLALISVFLITQSSYAVTNVRDLAAHGDVRIPDYGDGFVLAKPGHTVLGIWSQVHRYYEELDIHKAAFCDLFRQFNPQFSFTEQTGCDNPGFSRLPSGVKWYLPMATVSYDKIGFSSDESLVVVKTENYFGPAAMKNSSAFPYLVEQANDIAPKGQMAKIMDENAVVVPADEYAKMQETLKAQEAAKAAPKPQVTQQPVVQKETTAPLFVLLGTSVYTKDLALLGIGLILALAFFVRTRSLKKEVKEVNSARQVTETKLKECEEANLEKDKAISKLETDLQAATSARLVLADEISPEGVLKLKQRNRLLSENALIMPLPTDMYRSDGAREVTLHVLEWRDIPDASDARVYLPGAPNGIWLAYLASEGTWTWKPCWRHLNGASDAAKDSRAYLKILLRARDEDEVLPEHKVIGLVSVQPHSST